MVDAGITLEIESLVKSELQDLKGVFPEKAESLMGASEGIAEIIREAMVSRAPYKWGDLREGHTVEDVGPLEKYIFSDVPHFEPLVKGHTVSGINNSDRQRRWWFWYLEKELGGEYTPKTNGKVEANDYPTEALQSVDGEIDARLQAFLDEVFQ